MKFVDYAEIFVQAGRGGRGCVSFRREKYVPRGGPDGGDGGRGGHIIFRAAKDLNTLLDFRYRREYRANNGQHGMGQRMHGRDGEDLVIPVPLGTVIKDKQTGSILADLVDDFQEYVSARGGRGGQGNQHFATATRQVPRFAQPGEEGEEKFIILELKLLADVGLVGLPNSGKSTLISAVSAARPKIAAYPFTTLVPNLGVVKFGNYRSFVVADIPGLIEGAHKGAGLGFQFLRHIERTRIFLHIVDISDMSEADPVEQYNIIRQELHLYSNELFTKKHAVVASKLDAASDSMRLDILREYCKTNNIDFMAISSVTGKGIRELLKYLGDLLMKEREEIETDSH